MRDATELIALTSGGSNKDSEARFFHERALHGEIPACRE